MTYRRRTDVIIFFKIKYHPNKTQIKRVKLNKSIRRKIRVYQTEVGNGSEGENEDNVNCTDTEEGLICRPERELFGFRRSWEWSFQKTSRHLIPGRSTWVLNIFYLLSSLSLPSVCLALKASALPSALLEFNCTLCDVLKQDFPHVL